MYLVLLVVHVIVTLAMIVVILIQRPASDGLGGMGGGSGGGGFMTSRAQANLLTRTTAILATVFIVNSLALSWLTQRDVRARDLSSKIVEEQAAPQAEVPVNAPETPAPAAPMEVPVSE